MKWTVFSSTRPARHSSSASPPGKPRPSISNSRLWSQGLQEPADFTRDEKQRAATLTEGGVKKWKDSSDLENIYTGKGLEHVHHIEQALRAHAIYKRDVDYVVKDGESIIVDEFTGRLMLGPALSPTGSIRPSKPKEGVEYSARQDTYATITLQNYFRLYDKLAGMTGTAKTEEEEFDKIYKLRSRRHPDAPACPRADADRCRVPHGRTQNSVPSRKNRKGEIREGPAHARRHGVDREIESTFELLDAQGMFHAGPQREAAREGSRQIIAQAGHYGAITIATNMAGRGTDIMLGGRRSQHEVGGWRIVSRYGAPRVAPHRQPAPRPLRAPGRPGESTASTSRSKTTSCASSRRTGLQTMMERLGWTKTCRSRTGWFRACEGAQKKVEGHNFDIRNHVVQYDDVMNTQRELIYKRRQKI